jgi:AcrR family transcriptional regulator
MGITERREREREQLTTLIVEAARDILLEQGLDALSMRAIAERIEYSPATIYLYFRDKEELIRHVIHHGFERLAGYMREETRKLGEGAGAVEEFAALGRAYAHFALDNTAYFRVMFELPSVAQMDHDCPAPEQHGGPGEGPFDFVIDTVKEAAEGGLISVPNPATGALIGWGLIHGLTSLFLSGHLGEAVADREQFLALVDDAQRSLHLGWRPSSPQTSSGGSA